MLARTLRLTIGVALGWALVILAVETLWRRRQVGSTLSSDLEAAYRRHPKTRPTVEIRRLDLRSLAVAKGEH